MSKLVLKPLTVSMTPTQFGPISRIDAERRVSIRSFCRCLASGVSISPKPADMQIAPLTSLKRFFRSAISLATGTVSSAATIRMHMLDRFGDVAHAFVARQSQDAFFARIDRVQFPFVAHGDHVAQRGVARLLRVRRGAHHGDAFRIEKHAQRGNVLRRAFRFVAGTNQWRHYTREAPSSSIQPRPRSGSA